MPAAIDPKWPLPPQDGCPILRHASYGSRNKPATDGPRPDHASDHRPGPQPTPAAARPPHRPAAQRQPARQPEPGAPLRRAHPRRLPLPGAGDARKSTLPHAWRRQHRRAHRGRAGAAARHPHQDRPLHCGGAGLASPYRPGPPARPRAVPGGALSGLVAAGPGGATAADARRTAAAAVSAVRSAAALPAGGSRLGARRGRSDRPVATRHRMHQGRPAAGPSDDLAWVGGHVIGSIAGAGPGNRGTTRCTVAAARACPTGAGWRASRTGTERGSSPCNVADRRPADFAARRRCDSESPALPQLVETPPPADAGIEPGAAPPHAPWRTADLTAWPAGTATATASSPALPQLVEAPLPAGAGIAPNAAPPHAPWQTEDPSHPSPADATRAEPQAAAARHAPWPAPADTAPAIGAEARAEAETGCCASRRPTIRQQPGQPTEAPTAAPPHATWRPGAPHAAPPGQNAGRGTTDPAPAHAPWQTLPPASPLAQPGLRDRLLARTSGYTTTEAARLVGGWGSVAQAAAIRDAAASGPAHRGSDRRRPSG